MKRQTTFALVAVALAFLFALVVAEVVLRIYAATARDMFAHLLRADPYDVMVEPHGVEGYRPRPGREFTYPNGTASNINQSGFRGPEPARDRAPGTLRVLLFGGSTTHGWGVNDDQSVDQHMRELLAVRFPERRFEVINLAFDGYDSWQIVQRLRTDGLPLDPDVIIVNTGVNDVRNARYPDLAQDRPDPRTLLWKSETDRLRFERERGGPTLFTRLKHYLHVARVPGIVRQLSRPAPDALPVENPHPDAMRYFERNLRDIAAMAADTGAVLLLSSDPSSLRTKYQPTDTSHVTYWIKDAETTQVYRDSLDARLRQVADSARAAGDRVAYVPRSAFPVDAFIDDPHLTATGNRMLADLFVGTLAQFLTAPAP